MSLPFDRKLWAWALYDFANTIFSAVVLTSYFPLYLTERAGANWYLGAATTGSMILAGLVTPVLGALSDRTGRPRHYLFTATILCILSLCLITFLRAPAALISAFIVSCFFFHAALVFYNCLLPAAAAPERQGFASGLGTGLGYLGVVISLPIAHAVDQWLGRSWVFAATALLFALFSAPLFLYVPERHVENPVPLKSSLWISEWRKVMTLVRGLPARPALLLFLAGNFFAVDALNSTIFWLAVYTRETFHPPQTVLVLFLMLVNASAFGMGIIAGALTDRRGSSRVLAAAAGSLAVTLAICASSGRFILFAGACLTGGAFAIAGIWTAGRKRLIEMAPPAQLGEYFGLYGLTTKISVLGSLLFSLTADLAGFRPALWVLVFPAAAGFCMLFVSARMEK